MSRQWSMPTRIVVAVIILILLAYLLVELQPLIASLIIAALLAYTLNLFVRFLRRRTRLSQRWAAGIVYFFFLAIVIATPGTLIPLAIRQTETLSQELLAIRDAIESYVANPLVILGRTIPLDQMWRDLINVTPDFGVAADSALVVIETTSVSLLRLIIIVVTTYYLLMDWQGLRAWLFRLLPEQSRPDADRLLSQIDLAWRAYMQGTLALMLMMGIIFTIIGLAIGLPGAVPIGLLTGLFSMIPELGPTIAGIIASLVAFFLGSNVLPLSNFWFGLLVGGIYVVVMQIKSIWLRPQVMGRFMHMNTGLVFLAILAAVMLQGILAAFVILPILATVGIVGRYVWARLLNLDPWDLDQPAEAISIESAPDEEPDLSEDQP